MAQTPITSIQAKLLICITETGRSEQLLRASKAASSRGGRSAYWQTSAHGDILKNVDIADSEREIMFTTLRNKASGIVATSRDYFQLSDTVQRNRVSSVIEAFRAQSEKAADPFSTTVLVLDVPDFYVSPRKNAAENTNMERLLNMENRSKLIIIIVNLGMGEEVMTTARSAGAKGGTLLRSFGTKLQEGSAFFGVPLAPEKELLMIIADEKNTKDISLAVRGMSNFSGPGGGIIFSLDIDEVYSFGSSF